MTSIELEKIGEAELTRVRDHVQKVKFDAPNKEVAAHRLGISAAMMYELVNGNWHKISMKIFEQMQRFAGYRRDWQLVETLNYKQIRGNIRFAQKQQALYALIGETGTGKTFAAQHIVQNTPNAFYLLADATMSQKGFLDAIMSALGVVGTHNYRGIESKVKCIVHTLLTTGQPLLVIDDAGKLKMNCMKLVQIIYDRTVAKSLAGILLIGTETLYENVIKNAETNKYHMRELYGRIGQWDMLNYPNADDIQTICHKNGITDKDAITWLTNSTASLHTLNSMIEKALTLSQKNDMDITGEFLATMNGGKLWKDVHFKNFEQRLKKRA